MGNYSAEMKICLSTFLIHFCCITTQAQPCDCTYAESPCQTNAFNVFISYSGYDREIVMELTEALYAKDIPYWDYQESCEVGSNCEIGNIKTVIEDSELIVIVRSDNWDSSEMCKMEKKFIDGFQSSENSDNALNIKDLINKIASYHRRFPENYNHIFIEYWKN